MAQEHDDDVYRDEQVDADQRINWREFCLLCMAMYREVLPKLALTAGLLLLLLLILLPFARQ
jgi:hypothetical protein